MNVMLFQLKMAGINAAFMESFAAYKANWQDAMTLVPSTTLQEDYSWLGDVAQMEEWSSELVPRGLAEFDYSIRNKRFGTGMLIYHDDINDERYGQTLERVRDMAEKAKAFPTVLLRGLRSNGTSGLCYDGSPMFSTTHKEGNSGTQENLITGTGSTDAQIQADFEKMRTKMFSFKTDTGDIFVRSNPRFVAVCAAEMEIPLRRALMVSTVSTGGQNVYSGLVSAVEVDPGLTGKDWYLEDRGSRLKAYIYQERETVQPKNTVPGSDTDVKDDATLYTVKSRGNGGYGQWRHAGMIDNS